MEKIPDALRRRLRHNARMSEELKERIQFRLEALGKSARSASLDAGLGADAVRNVLRERSKYPRGDTLRDLANALDCSIDWLMTGRNAQARGHTTLPKIPDGQMAGKAISEIDIRAGMGGGGEAPLTVRTDALGNTMMTDDVVGNWSFPDSYLRAELRVKSDTARIIEVQGDSMEPTLRAGDRVMINTADKRPTPPGVFALWDGFGVVVKRIEHIPNSDPPTIKVQSDNAYHGEYRRTLDEVNIIGRLVWYARRL